MQCLCVCPDSFWYVTDPAKMRLCKMKIHRKHPEVSCYERTDHSDCRKFAFHDLTHSLHSLPWAADLAFRCSWVSHLMNSPIKRNWPFPDALENVKKKDQPQSDAHSRPVHCGPGKRKDGRSEGTGSYKKEVSSHWKLEPFPKALFPDERLRVRLNRQPWKNTTGTDKPLSSPQSECMKACMFVHFINKPSPNWTMSHKFYSYSRQANYCIPDLLSPLFPLLFPSPDS